MTQFQRAQLRLGARKNQKFKTRAQGSFSRENLLSLLVLILMCTGISWASINALDKNIYPGCKVISEDTTSMQGAKILVIELDPELNIGTDTACMLAGQLIYEITLDGYLVHVINSHMTSLGLIDEKMAKLMAEGY
jgi:hypothetical protein